MSHSSLEMIVCRVGVLGIPSPQPRSYTLYCVFLHSSSVDFVLSIGSLSVI
jgi:hypothetical protein